MEFKSWESFILNLGRILCYILVVFEQDIVFGAYLTLQAESREDVDVFLKKASFYLNFELKKGKAYLCTYDTNVIVEYQQQNGRTCSSPASTTSDGK